MNRADVACAALIGRAELTPRRVALSTSSYQHLDPSVNACHLISGSTLERRKIVYITSAQRKALVPHARHDEPPLTLKALPQPSPALMPSDKPSAKVNAKRSRKGCWTCKERHKKCDETRPTCRRCTVAGIACGGYDLQLTWGAPNAKQHQGGQLLRPIRTNKRKLLPETVSTASPGSDNASTPASLEGVGLWSEKELDDFWSRQGHDIQEHSTEHPEVEDRLMENCK